MSSYHSIHYMSSYHTYPLYDLPYISTIWAPTTHIHYMTYHTYPLYGFLPHISTIWDPTTHIHYMTYHTYPLYGILPHISTIWPTTHILYMGSYHTYPLYDPHISTIWVPTKHIHYMGSYHTYPLYGHVRPTFWALVWTSWLNVCVCLWVRLSEHTLTHWPNQGVYNQPWMVRRNSAGFFSWSEASHLVSPSSMVFTL